VALTVWDSGCADPGPEMMSAAPLRVEHAADGSEERLYDTNRDGKADYRERLGKEGRVVLLRFDLNGDEQIDLEVDRALRQLDSKDGPDRHLVVLLDSIPYGMVRDLYEQGRFRLFYPPSRTIAPFPAMTDPAFAEFFGTSPSPAVESQFYTRAALNNGYSVYAHELNAGWLSRVDYHLPFLAHSVAYFWPFTWYDHELGNIQRNFYQRDSRIFVGYVVCTSALGAQNGRNGHQGGLVRLDRFCQSVMHRLRGRVQITLLTDHGHNLIKSTLVPLPKALKQMGYHVTETLKGPQDVVVPEFGAVSCAAIYTQSPAAVARDLLGVEGVEHTVYLAEGDAVVIASRNGRARVSSGASGLKYECEYGDPLEMLPVMEGLRAKGAIDSQGFVDDRTLLAATVDHKYPDAVHRLWRAFHGLIENQPDVLVAVQDGWHCGSPFMSSLLNLAAVHGNLGQLSSSGFAMTTMGALPPVVRTADLRPALVQLGVPFSNEPKQDGASSSKTDRKN